MQHWPRIAMILLLGALLLVGACTPSQTPPVAAPASGVSLEAPTSTPDELVFAADARVAGVDVAGMTVTVAAELLREKLVPINQPLRLQVGATRLTIFPQAHDLDALTTELLEAAQQQAAQGETVQVPLAAALDTTQLERQLTTLASEIASTTTFEVITATDTITRSFGYMPGRTLDVDSALEQITTHLNSLPDARTITLDLREDPTVPRPTFAQVQEQVTAIAEQWDGVVGFYLYDLQTGETVTYNPDTVFSGASMLKVPIMLFVYTQLPAFDAEQEQWMREMIIDSNNLSANDLLAATVGGIGTDAAYEGSQAMNQMLRDLGFEHTYQNMPYEAGDYLIGVRGLAIERGPAEEGTPPYTQADPIVRTTPAEISRMFLWIDQCSRGEGLLLEQFADALSAERCQEMLDLLAKNADRSRLVAGLPAGTRIEHKNGWTDDMHADVGIVRSDGGDFLIATYIYQEQNNSYLPDFRAARYISALAHLAYTAYNPVKVE